MRVKREGGLEKGFFSFSRESGLRFNKNVVKIFSRNNISSNKLDFLFVVIELFFILLESKELVFDNFVLVNHIFDLELLLFNIYLESFDFLVQNIHLIIVSVLQSFFSEQVALFEFQSLFLKLFCLYLLQVKNLVSQRVNLSLQSSNFVF